MTTPARPTLRCLKEDLPNDWSSAGDHAMATSGDLDRAAWTLRHPIIRKAAGDFSADGSDSEVARESISGLSDPVWWKVKIGARWRGAVYVDPTTGQAWLCAAGYRREREATDFYKEFMANVQAHGPDVFLPTQADFERLAVEAQTDGLLRWEHRVHEEVRAAMRRIVAGGTAELGVSHPGEPKREIVRVALEVNCESIEESDLAEVMVTVDYLDYAVLPLIQWVEIVILGAIDPREQFWSALPVGGRPAFSGIYEDEAIEAWVASLDDTGDPGVVLPGEVAHYAHRARLTDQIVEGEGAKALCGAWFVPRQDHEGRGTCAHCEAIHRALPPD